jgi:pyridoxal phosphate phosphatase PHOSPHO2
LNSNLSTKAKRLYAFDFDHTIIEENSDYEVKKLLKNPLPSELAYNGSNFTAYMDEVMKFIGSEGTAIADVGNFMKTLKFVPGKNSKILFYPTFYSLFNYGLSVLI